MKKLFTLFILISLCAIVVPCYSVTTTNSQQDPKREQKVKLIHVSGIVTDEQGKPLDGVDVLKVRESDSDYIVGVTTSNGGKYSFLTASNFSYEFSKKGYISQIIKIKGRDEIDVIMKAIKNK